MADMTIAFTVTGTMNGKKVSWSATATVADVDDVLTASADGISGDPNFFTALAGSTDSSTQHSYDGMSAVLFVGGNQGGLNRFDLVGAIPLAAFAAPSGFPIAVYNGGGFNGMFNQGTTANDAPDEDPEAFSGDKIVGRVRYSAIGALKAIS